MGKERVRKRSPSPLTSTPRVGSPGRAEFGAGTSQSFRRGAVSKSTRRPAHMTPVPEKTNELARNMNADVLQAEPLGDGPIHSIVIPPGIVNDNRTTIVSIQQPTAVADIEEEMTSQVANRSIQVISETLDEQDAAEAAAVQNRLADLQQARRDFVIAVANVGGNAVNIGEETGVPPSAATLRPPPIQQLSPQRPRRGLYRVPDIEDQALRVEYGRDHPDVVAAREFMQRTMAELQEKEAERRMEEEFERIARDPGVDELRLDIPFEEEIMHEGDISWEEDAETGMELPIPSRIKASMPAVPRRQETYQYDRFDPEELERFFDVQRYPPSPLHRPPPGREHLHPDLWELDDPWYRPPPEPDMPDLIDFDT